MLNTTVVDVHLLWKKLIFWTVVQSVSCLTYFCTASKNKFSLEQVVLHVYEYVTAAARGTSMPMFLFGSSEQYVWELLHSTVNVDVDVLTLRIPGKGSV